MGEIHIIHKDWEGICIIENDIIYRKNCSEESGNYTINKNKLLISWHKWDTEIYYYYNNEKYYYLETIFNEKFTNYIFFEDIQILYLVFNKKNNNFFSIDNKNIENCNYLIEDNIITLNFKDTTKKYKNINNYYYYTNDLNNTSLFELNIVNNLTNEIYIFNKKNKKFYSTKNIENSGKYEIIDNCIYMDWDNGTKKSFYSNKYISNFKNDITIIKPKKIIIENRVLFSNISLCKKKIIFTSIYYKENNWNIDEISIIVKNNNIINKVIYENNDYESSLTIIIELEEELNNVSININYKKYNFEIYLEQLKIKDNNISAMTLFNNDYMLLKKYLKYYSNYGVEIFFLYYNKKIDNSIIDNLIKLNDNNYKIYLIEWDYSYWWFYNDMKHHHSQTMAINDSLNILKNYGKYILYNDLDEYFILDKYNNFNDMIKDNITVDLFVFKNRFCKMGEDLIKYKDFDEKFDLSIIILGNYWISQREKNLVKLENINVMGVHNYFKKFNDDSIIEKVIGQFYHIINFEEKYREELMTEFIT